MWWKWAYCIKMHSSWKCPGKWSKSSYAKCTEKHLDKKRALKVKMSVMRVSMKWKPLKQTLIYLVGPSSIINVKVNEFPCSVLMYFGSTVTIIFEDWYTHVLPFGVELIPFFPPTEFMLWWKWSLQRTWQELKGPSLYLLLYIQNHHIVNNTCYCSIVGTNTFYSSRWEVLCYL